MGLAPVWQADIRRHNQRQARRLQDDGSRAQQGVFQLCRRTDDDRRRDSTDLFGGQPRRPEIENHAARNGSGASVQAVVDEAILRMGRHVHERTGSRNFAWPAESRSIAWPPAASRARGRFEDSGRSRRRAMRAGRWARRCGSGINGLKQPRTVKQPDAMRGAFSARRFQHVRSPMTTRCFGGWEQLGEPDRRGVARPNG